MTAAIQDITRQQELLESLISHQNMLQARVRYMGRQLGLSIEEILSRLRHFENVEVTNNSYSKYDKKAIHMEIRSPREEVAKLRHIVVNTCACHIGNQDAPESTTSQVESSDNDIELPTVSKWKSAKSQRISTAARGDEHHLPRWSHSHFFFQR